MQKKLIALAVASLVPAPVFAQSQVSIYGIVDAAIDSGNYGGATGRVQRLTSGGYSTSRLGFKGSEDLGNGMKANFVLETGLLADTGMLDNASGQFWQRTSTIGLSGSDWGSVNFGRQYSPLYTIQATNDIFRVVGIGSNYALNNVGQTRVSNSIRYDSPSINGFSAAAMYGMGDTGAASGFQESSTNPKDLGRHSGLNLRYGNGAAKLSLGWSKQKSTATAAGGVVELKTTVLAGSYDFKFVAINAGWQQARNDVGPRTTDNRIWTLGATVPVFGKDSIKVAYNDLHSKLATSSDAKLISLGYVHPMSRRTTLYGTWAKMTNESLAAVTLYQAPAVGAAGYDPSAVQVGISHSF